MRPLEFASLGSGSQGNALVVAAGKEANRTVVMIDCGFGIRETERRLARLGVAPSGLSAVVLTHEHHDHVAGAFKLARRFDLPVWLTRGTCAAAKRAADGAALNFCRDGEPFQIGALTFAPFTVPHDAREPVQFSVTDGCSKLGILTDAGQATPHIRSMLGGCDAILIECNHDQQMLADSTYPARLKSRISGGYGHLSNHRAADILAGLDRSRLKVVVAAHLSKENNTPELARTAVSAALESSTASVVTACQDDGFDWIRLDS